MSTSPTPEELRQLTERTQSFVPKAVERQPSGFLSLAPATSASYPRAPNPRQPSETGSNSSLTAAALAAEAAKQGDNLELIKRRTSSLSSDGGKNPNGFRFLKLGPVHWGEHPGDHKADWHEVAIE